MKYCTRCILPETYEAIQFDENGVCNVCRSSNTKHYDIDWAARRKMLEDLAERYRGRGQYDCIVPFSGGKDSTFQLWFVVRELKLKPLVVRFNHWGYRPRVHENNLRTFRLLGVDVLEFTPKWDVVRQLMLCSLRERGDFCWHCHTGVFAHTMQVAVRYQIPLVIWGESSSEYAGYYTARDMEELDEKFFNSMVNLGLTADDMYHLLDGRVDRRDLMPFEFPSQEQMQTLGARAIFLGNYIPWDTRRQVEIIKQELGWQGQPVEGIPKSYDYEKIECRWQGIRDYCKYLKRGVGRTNHLACIDIRSGHLERQNGFDMAQKYDGCRPASLDNFLEILGIDEKEFQEILSRHAAPMLDHKDGVARRGAPLEDMPRWDKLV